MANNQSKREHKKFMKEEFYNFWENPTRTAFRDLLKNNVGEFDILDFKESFPEFSKISRTILAISNLENGCVILGVKEEKDGVLKPVGLENLIDKADITKKIKKYLPIKLFENIEISNLSYEDSDYKKLIGKKFQIIFIPYKPEHIPYVSKADGEGIEIDTIYIRRKTESARANYEELQDIINRRIETKYSSSREMNLKVHLEQLKKLYEEIPQTISYSPFLSNLGLVIPRALLGEVKPNPEYPKESYNEFILKMLDKKKKLIAEELGVGD